MSEWKVWIEQINAEMVEVEALTKEDAISEAKMKWKRETFPEVRHVEELI